MASASPVGPASNSGFSAEGLLEASLPGFSLVSGVAKAYYHVDVTALLVYIIPIALVVLAGKFLYQPLASYLTPHAMARAEIRSDDELYDHILYWMGKQRFAEQTLSFVAGMRASNQWRFYGYDEELDNVNEAESDWSLAEQDFDKYWTRVVRNDKSKPILCTPGNGYHWFKYKGRWMIFTREATGETMSRSYGSPARSETLYVACFGRDNGPVKDLLREAQAQYVQRDGMKTLVYRRNHEREDWERCLARPPRPLSTVVLDQQQKDEIIADIREYLLPSTRQWYNNRGIPYRRGYLLHGPPGTGKTSLCIALAGVFQLKVYVLSLIGTSMTDEGLAMMFSMLPKRCIVLLEDIDTAGLTHERSNGKDEEEDKDGEKKGAAAGRRPDTKTDESNSQKSRVSLSGLLNVIDGVSSNEGRILLMTTNFPEKLDAALLRPGRVDLSIKFENASHATAQELFRSTYSSHNEDLDSAQPAARAYKKILVQRKQIAEGEVADLAVRFADQIPPGEFSPAAIQGYLLKNKRTPQKAAEGVAQWVKTTKTEQLSLRSKHGAGADVGIGGGGGGGGGGGVPHTS